jgi:hypothetical protein
MDICHVGSKTQTHYTEILCSITYDKMYRYIEIFSYREGPQSIVSISGKLLRSVHKILDDRTHVNTGTEVL